MPEIDTLPANLDAERSILGAILLSPKAYDEAASAGLSADDFSLDSHRRIYRCMEVLGQSGKPIDTVTVVTALIDAKKLDDIGGAAYVTSLTEGVPILPSIKTYVRIAREKSAQRRIIHACNSAVGGIADQMSSSDAMGYLQDQMLQIATGTDEAPAERVLKFSDQAYAEWLEVANGTGEIVGLPTGIRSLDNATTGIRRGEQWVVGARTGNGKTNFGLQVAGAACREDHAVGIFSLEMSRNALLERVWAQSGRIPYQNVRFPRFLPPERKQQIERAMLSVAKWPLYITDEAGITLSKLLAKAKLMIRMDKVELLVIDYVQKILAPGKDERTQITKVSEGLRALAKDTGVPIILLSQFSRADQANRNKRPTKYDFKESGALENDAHVCLLIHRPVDDLNRPTGLDEIIVDKQRGGQQSIENVVLADWLRFEEREPNP